ncbi:MarR family winged helix-turn-helix transcriptional regulator [Neobacillus jeddahensis]|uniref:MarR family winged helix-turn-helix transcriptional regulator n=1 Tax=Neobacillus jeddahensis TaxID=1461580 RepID=UPI00058F25F8|nr:MarR family transcriptional regulator [Neobacillus jeddahensis]
MESGNFENNLMGQEFSFALIMFHQQIAEKLGLNVTDYKVLGIITNEGVTAGEIASKSGLSTGMVTTVVDRLEKKNFVYRDKHPNDRRKVIIKRNIEKTKTEMVPIFQSFGVEMGKLFSSYNESELKTILHFLKISIDIFTKETEKLKST